MSTYTTEAVILRARDFGEADRLLILYTLAQGKVTAKVRGARKPKSRLAGATLPLTHSEVMLWRGRSSIQRLTQAVCQEGFGPLREDIRRLAHANLVVELTDLLTEEGVPSPDVFVGLLGSLSLIAFGERPQMAAFSFAWRMLAAAGLGAGFERCAACGRDELPAGEVLWLPGRAVPLCRRCVGAEDGLTAGVSAGGVSVGSGGSGGGGSAGRGWGRDGGGPAPIKLRPDTVKIIGELRAGNPRVVAALRPATAARQQLRMVLWDCLRVHLDRPPKSLAFLDSLEQVGGRGKGRE